MAFPLKIILASQSPRRKELLSQALEDLQVQASFAIIPAHIDESRHSNEAPLDYVLRMAQEKATAVSQSHLSDHTLILAADTIVTYDQEILGKPINALQASNMLTQLSARTHRVITAFGLVFQSPQHSEKIIDYDVTKVTFHSLSPSQIQAYCQTDEPYDKAGSYAIQGSAGAFVKEYQGSYSNVVGFPLEKITPHLINFINL